MGVIGTKTVESALRVGLWFEKEIGGEVLAISSIVNGQILH